MRTKESRHLVIANSMNKQDIERRSFFGASSKRGRIGEEGGIGGMSVGVMVVAFVRLPVHSLRKRNTNYYLVRRLTCLRYWTKLTVPLMLRA